ncbi:MAG: hypothetical protein HY720_33035 [Planctomycetes bacterium]|nr:hypothetical protein [Planctomycetota bacterium]
MAERPTGYRTDPGGELLPVERVVDLVRRGSLDLGRPVLGPDGRRGGIESFPEIVDRLLRGPEEIAAAELAGRLAAGQCLHCPKKGAVRYERRRVTGFAHLCRERAGLDFACPGCQARAIQSDLLATAWGGWWGFPGAWRSGKAVRHGISTLVGPGTFRGVFQGLLGLLLVLSPLFVAALVALAFVRPGGANDDWVDLRAEGVYQERRIQAGERAALVEEYRARLAEKETPGADDHYLLARVLPDPAEALAEYDCALALEPGHVPAILESARALGKLGRWRESAERARRAGGEDPYAAELEADALAALGDREGAIRRLEEATARSPDSVPLRIALVYELLATDRGGRYDEARRAVEEARRVVAGEPLGEAWTDLARGVVEREAGDFDEALARFEGASRRSGRLDETAATARLEAWLTLLEEGDLVRAEEAAPAAASALGGDAERSVHLALWRGVALVEAGKAGEARQVWSDALAAWGDGDPEADPYPAAAIALLLKERVDSADHEEFRDQARVIGRPRLENNVEFVVGLSRVLSGDLSSAVEEFARAESASWGRNFPYYTALRWRERLAGEAESGD